MNCYVLGIIKYREISERSWESRYTPNNWTKVPAPGVLTLQLVERVYVTTVHRVDPELGC